jgi:sugar phosphate isomerase/epimerase
MLGLSTSWNAWQCEDARQLIFEIKAAGFLEVELSFNLTKVMVREIAGLVKEGQIKVVSLHNFCPIPDNISRLQALPDCYSLSSLDQQERHQALVYTKRSIDTAKEIGAKAVVLHCGRVEIADRTRALIELYERGLRDSQEFKVASDAMIMERQAYAEPNFAQALRSIEELNCYAKKAGIFLGIETRFYYREIPSFQEIGVILNKFKGSNVFYWHDTGHAQVMDNLGLASHEDYLKLYAKDMLGIHLHNLIGCSDHQAPCRGDFDFNRLKSYLLADTIKIIESHQQASAEDLKLSKVYLERIFNGRNS